MPIRVTASMYDFNLSAFFGHIFSGAAVVGSLVNVFPAVAASVALVWYLIQVYESKWMQTRLSTRRLRQIARLKVEIARLEALELVAHPANRIDILPAKIAAAELLEEARAEAKQVLADAVKESDRIKTAATAIKTAEAKS